jgi:hypothetical protein
MSKRKRKPDPPPHSLRQIFRKVITPDRWEQLTAHVGKMAKAGNAKAVRLLAAMKKKGGR